MGYAVERLFAAAYPEHGYGLPVLGTESDLAALTLERAREYQARHYRPGNALVTVTGRFDPKRVRAALGSAFEPLPRDGTPAPVAVVPPPPRPRVEERLPGRFSMVLVGWRAPEVKRPVAAMELMASILGDPTSGRLARGLTGPERSFVQVRSGVDARQHAALLYVYALLAPGTDAAAAESALLDTINALTLHAVTETELADARARLELAARIDLQTSRGVARAIGTGALVDGDPTALWKRLNEARAMTPKALQQLARDLLTASRRSIVVLSGEVAPGSGSPP
jgi:zinc protease